MKNNKGLVKSGIFSFGQRFSGIFLNFGTFFFMVRMYPKSEFGTWALFMAILAVIEVARAGLIRNGKILYINSTNNADSLRAINTASLSMNCLFSIAVACLLTIFGTQLAQIWSAPTMSELFYYYNFSLLFMTFNAQLEYLLFAKINFRGAFWGTSLRFGTLFLFVATCFFINYRPPLRILVLIQALGAALSTLVLYFFAKDYLKFSKTLSKEWLSKLFHYGKYTFGTNISSMLNRYIDQAMVGGMLSPVAVAAYSAAIRISTLIETPTRAVASLVFPATAKKIKTEGKESVKEIYEKSVGVILAVTVPAIAFALLFPEFVIRIIAGKAYLNAVPLLQITVFYSLFIPYLRQFGTIMDAIGRPKLNFTFVILNATLNIIFNYIFIKNFGFNGAAYGTLSSYAILFTVNQIVLFKILNVSTLKTLHHALLLYGTLFRRSKKIVLKQFS